MGRLENQLQGDCLEKEEISSAQSSESRHGSVFVTVHALWDLLVSFIGLQTFQKSEIEKEKPDNALWNLF